MSFKLHLWWWCQRSVRVEERLVKIWNMIDSIWRWKDRLGEPGIDNSPYLGQQTVSLKPSKMFWLLELVIIIIKCFCITFITSVNLIIIINNVQGPGRRCNAGRCFIIMFEAEVWFPMGNYCHPDIRHWNWSWSCDWN